MQIQHRSNPKGSKSCSNRQKDIHSFQNLTKLAKIVLSVTATSVPFKSLFSQAGITSDNLRIRLNPNLLEKLVLLNQICNFSTIFVIKFKFLK